MSQEHKIITIRDLENIVTKENVECFKTDFCRWLDILVKLKALERMLPGTISYNQEKGFRWIDDGRTDINLSIDLKQ